MKIHVYTSQSLNYFNSIGKYSIASILKYAPKNVEITITTEDYTQFPKLNSQINVIDLYSLNNGFKEFEDRHRGISMAKVTNFAKKGYTVLYACENPSADIMIWLDADAHFKVSVDENWINNLIKDCLGAQMGVTHDDGEFTVESGFFIMNLNHPGLKDFARFYRDYYDNDRSQNMGRFYDSNVHGHVVKNCEKIGHKFVEMNLRQKGNTPIRGSMIDGTIAHFKGKAKQNAEEYYKLLGFNSMISQVLA